MFEYPHDHNDRHPYLKQQGFNLLELMLTIIVAAAVLTIGIPSFQSTIDSNLVATQSNSLLTGFRHARSEAVRRGETVTLCKSSNASSCSTEAGETYEIGWIAFVDSNEDGVKDAGEEIIRAAEAMPDSVSVLSTGNVGSYVSYELDGTGDVAGDTPSGNINITTGINSRYLCFDGLGRIRIKESSC